MKTDAKKLHTAMSDCLAVAGKRTTLPVLSMFKLEADGKNARITATNLDCTVTRTVLATGKLAPVCVPAALITKLMGTRDGETELKEVKGELHVGGVAVMNTVSADEFPNTTPPKLTAMECDGPSLGTAMKQVAAAICQDAGRYILRGIHIHGNKVVLTVEATNGRWLAQVKIPSAAECDIIVPEESVPMVIAALIEGATVAANNNVVQVTNETGSVSAKLIEGRFPNTTAVIPKKTRKIGELNVTDATRLIRNAQLFTSDKANAVKLEFGKHGLAVSANSPDVGEFKDATGSGFDALTAAMDPAFLLHALNGAGEDTAEIRGSDELSPITITASGYLAVLMPMRMS